MVTRALCGFVSAVGELTLLGGNVASPDPLLSLGMVFSQVGALLERLG